MLSRETHPITKLNRLLVLSAAVALLVCAPAGASVTRTVLPGESLWSIATANGLSPASLAAANGLAADAYVIEGTDIVIPAAGETVSGAPSGGAPQPLGSYVVRLGDTLTNIAERSGVPTASVAAMNGLDPSGVLQAGTVLKLPTGAALQPSAPAPDQRIVPDAAPYPTSEVVSSATIGSDRGLPRRAGLPGRGHRVAGERVRQLHGLRRERARRDADPSRHMDLDQRQPLLGAARTRTPRRTTSRPGSCISDSSCATRAGTAPSPWPRTTRDSDRCSGSACCPRPSATWTTCSP